MPSTWPANIPKSRFKEATELSWLRLWQEGAGAPKSVVPCCCRREQMATFQMAANLVSPTATSVPWATSQRMVLTQTAGHCPRLPATRQLHEPEHFAKCRMTSLKKRLRLIKVCSRAQLKESSKVDVREKSILNIYILNVSPIQCFVSSHKHALLSTWHLENLELRCEPCKPNQPWWFCFQVTPWHRTSSFFSFQTKSL